MNPDYPCQMQSMIADLPRRCHGRPNTRALICSSVKRSRVLPGSGQINLPWLSRLMASHTPMPSCAKTLIRVACGWQKGTHDAGVQHRTPALPRPVSYPARLACQQDRLQAKLDRYGSPQRLPQPDSKSAPACTGQQILARTAPR